MNRPGWLRWPTLLELSNASVLAWTSHAHWTLAGQLAMPTALRAALPVAVDVYYLAALRARRDRLAAVALAVVSIAGAHAASQYDLAEQTAVRSVVAALLGVVLALTLWRTHELRHAELGDAREVARVEVMWRGRWRGLLARHRETCAALERMAGMLVAERDEHAAAAAAAVAAERARVADEVAAAVAGERERVAAEVADLRRQLADALAAPPAGSGHDQPPEGGDRDGQQRPPWGTTFDSQVVWLRRELAAGRRFTGEHVADLMGLGSRRAGGSRLAAARKLHAVKAGAEAVS